MGFEPTRAEHNRLAVYRLNHSATSSSCIIGGEKTYLSARLCIQEKGNNERSFISKEEFKDTRNRPSESSKRLKPFSRRNTTLHNFSSKVKQK